MFNYGSFVLTSLVGLVRSTTPDYIFTESPPLSVSFPGFLGSLAWRSRVIFNISDLWPDSVVAMTALPRLSVVGPRGRRV